MGVLSPPIIPDQPVSGDARDVFAWILVVMVVTVLCFVGWLALRGLPLLRTVLGSVEEAKAVADKVDRAVNRRHEGHPSISDEVATIRQIADANQQHLLQVHQTVKEVDQRVGIVERSMLRVEEDVKRLSEWKGRWSGLPPEIDDGAGLAERLDLLDKRLTRSEASTEALIALMRTPTGRTPNE